MKNYKLFNKIDISFLNPYNKRINLKNVKKEIEKRVPPSLFSEIDIIYVGKFDFLYDHYLTSKFMDNAIYLSNIADCDSDVIYDIMAALGNSIEKKYMHLFYDNKDVVKELRNYWNAGQRSSEDFSDAVFEFFIESKEKTREEMPAFCSVLEEIMRNG